MDNNWYGLIIIYAITAVPFITGAVLIGLIVRDIATNQFRRLTKVMLIVACIVLILFKFLDRVI